MSERETRDELSAALAEIDALRGLLHEAADALEYLAYTNDLTDEDGELLPPDEPQVLERIYAHLGSIRAAPIDPLYGEWIPRRTEVVRVDPAFL